MATRRGKGETYCSHLSRAFIAVTVRKLVSRIVLITSALSLRCDKVVMLEAAHRPCCSGGGVGPHSGEALGSRQVGGGGAPHQARACRRRRTSPHTYYVCGSPVAGESFGSSPFVLAARGTGGPNDPIL